MTLNPTSRYRRPSTRWDKTNCLPTVFPTKDRLGDNLTARLNTFKMLNASRLPLNRGLNLETELSGYEAETRLLVKLATTGYIVKVIQRFGCVLDAYLHEFPLEAATGWPDWRQELETEREKRVHDFREWMVDEKWFSAELGNERQQLELLTLMKYDLTIHYETLTDSEVFLIEDIYALVTCRSGVVLGELPSWFLPPSEVLTMHNWNHFLHGVHVTVAYGNDGYPQEHWEEACIRQASVWASLCHPHMAELKGACHVGAKPLFVHEPTEQNRANAHSWEPLLGCGLALQYLHEQGLGYSNLSPEKLVVRKFVTSQGLLSGLGLVRLPDQRWTTGTEDVLESIAQAALSFCGVNFCTVDECTSEKPGIGLPSDIFNFGIAILSARRSLVLGPLKSDQRDRLPPTCPRYLYKKEVWTLLKGMSAPVPSQVNMAYVVHRLKCFVETAGCPLEEKELSGMVADIDTYLIPSQERNIMSIMRRIRDLYSEIPVYHAEGKESVYHRLEDIYLQLRLTDNVSRTILNVFGSILGQFLDFLELLRPMEVDEDQSKTHKKRLKLCASEIAAFCAARTERQTILCVHHAIDEMIRQITSNTQQLTTNPSSWKKEIDRAKKHHAARFNELLGDLVNHPVGAKVKEEAATLLEFEIQSGRNSYSPDMLLRMTRTSMNLRQNGIYRELPPWFIPPYHVQLGSYVASGGFADVYTGKWLGADVAVKVQIHDEKKSDEELQIELMQEVEHWAALNHQNVLKMYGACHVGEAFIVCECAKSTLPTYLADADKSHKLWCLYQAALGLQYLHEHGLVHDDLKANNIMVGYDRKVKLIDFGLSQQNDEHKPVDVHGAIRWKAPERLQRKSPATIQSDVYAFGMCIVEILSGEKPWGNNYPDAGIKYAITLKKMSIPKPALGFENELHWNLVKLMCCREPEKRITMSAVVDYLYSFRFA